MSADSGAAIDPGVVRPFRRSAQSGVDTVPSPEANDDSDIRPESVGLVRVVPERAFLVFIIGRDEIPDIIGSPTDIDVGCEGETVLE